MNIVLAYHCRATQEATHPQVLHTVEPVAPMPVTHQLLTEVLQAKQEVIMVVTASQVMGSMGLDQAVPKVDPMEVTGDSLMEDIMDTMLLEVMMDRDCLSIYHTFAWRT